VFSTFEAVRAEALFLSSLQSSERPTAGAVRDAVTTTVRRLGVRGCAAQVADEFGDHPDTAVPRMTWALAMVRAIYPTRSAQPRPTQACEDLALAS
jgi:hypothetical protein